MPDDTHVPALVSGPVEASEILAALEEGRHHNSKSPHVRDRSQITCCDDLPIGAPVELFAMGRSWPGEVMAVGEEVVHFQPDGLDSALEIPHDVVALAPMKGDGTGARLWAKRTYFRRPPN